MRLEAFHKKNLVKAKKIMVDSVTNQLVPQVSSLKTPTRFDSLTKLFEGKNIDQNMTLRNQLKNVKIQNAETIKEQLQAGKEEVKNAEVVMATLNGLPGSWNPFIQGMCSRRNWLLSAEFGKKKNLVSEDQALIVQIISLNQWGIWRSQLLKNFWSTSAFG